MNKKKDLAKNTLIIAIGKVSTQFLSFFLLPLYTSFLTPDQFGTVDLVMTYVTISIPIITLSSERALFRYLIDARSDKKKQGFLIRDTIELYLCGYLVLALLFGVINFIFPIVYGWLVYIVIVTVATSGLFMQVARGIGDNVKFSIASAIAGISNILLNILLIVIFRFGGEALMISTALANLLCVAYLATSLNIHKLINKNYTRQKDKKNLLKYSIPLIPSTLSWWGINAFSRTIIVASLGATSNGIYAVAYKFPQIFTSLFSFFSLAWQESASVHINSKDASKFYSEVMNSTIKTFVSLSVLITAGVAVFFEVFIGERYSDARIYVPIMMIGVVFYAILDVYSGMYIAKKMTNQVFKTSMVAAIISVTSTVILIQTLGLFAPAIGSGLGYLIMSVLRHYDLKKYITVTYNHKTVIIAVFSITIVTALYYINTKTTDIIALVMAIILSYMMNRSEIKSLTTAAKHKFKPIQSKT